MSMLAEDQRRDRRIPLNGPALIAVDGVALCICEMVDFNATGIRLSVDSEVAPDRFTLIDLAAGIAYSARVVWRQPPAIGVALLNARYVEDPGTPEWITALWYAARKADEPAA